MPFDEPWFDTTLCLIGGSWQPAPATLTLVNPSDGSALAEIARGGPAEVDAAVAAATGALAGDWGRLTATERGRILSAIGQRILDRVDDLARLEALDVGKPLTQARDDAVAMARYMEFYGGAADKVMGETIPYLDGYTVYTLREPHGVTGHIETDDQGNREVVVDSNRTAQVLPGEYYGYISSAIAEQFIYDANYINLRQVRIGYELPDVWLDQTPLQRVRASIVGRNLFYLYDSVPNVNPGAEYNSASTPGLEYASVPQTRNFGFELRVTF